MNDKAVSTQSLNQFVGVHLTAQTDLIILINDSMMYMTDMMNETNSIQFMPYRSLQSS